MADEVVVTRHPASDAARELMEAADEAADAASAALAAAQAAHAEAVERFGRRMKVALEIDGIALDFGRVQRVECVEGEWIITERAAPDEAPAPAAESGPRGQKHDEGSET